MYTKIATGYNLVEKSLFFLSLAMMLPSATKIAKCGLNKLS